MRKLLLGLVLVLGVTTFTSCQEEEVPQCEFFYPVPDGQGGWKSHIYYDDCN